MFFLLSLSEKCNYNFICEYGKNYFWIEEEKKVMLELLICMITFVGVLVYLFYSLLNAEKI